jgi:predicted NBD/HSP70 family sugar kinase
LTPIYYIIIMETPEKSSIFGRGCEGRRTKIGLPKIPVLDAYVLAFDVGGTKTYAALASPGGEMVAQAQASTVRWSGQPDYAQFFVRLRDDLLYSAGVAAGKIRVAGVAVAGIIDPANDWVTMCPNISDGDFDLRSLLEKALGVPALVENDVNLAAVGEHWRGVAQGCANFAFVAIGTGIGSGLFINGQLYRGAHNAAGEVGHLYTRGMEHIGPDKLGALERRASGAGIVETARLYVRKAATYTTLDADSLTTAQVFQAAQEGDTVAQEVREETLDSLSLGLANLSFLLDPELIVLGGGVSMMGDELISPLRARLTRLLVKPLAPRLELSQLGAKAQIMGAVRVALDFVENE